MRRKTKDVTSVSEQVLNAIIENFATHNKIYFDEILGNVICVYKENIPNKKNSTEYTMEKALEFYYTLLDALNLDSTLMPTLMYHEFVHTVHENREKLISMVDGHVENDSMNNSSEKTPDETCAFSVLIKNKRRTQDDRALIISNLKYYLLESVDNSKIEHLEQFFEVEKLQVYAVFDGHNGYDVSNYGYIHLGTVLMRLLLDNFDPGNPPYFNLNQILVMAVDQLNQNIEIRHTKIHSGSTITIIIKYKEFVCTAWRGDSQAVIIDDQCQFHKINTNLHQVSDQSEQRLLEQYFHENVSFKNLGGVTRTNGSLLVSRSLGDFDIPTVPVTDLRINHLKGGEKFLLLATDGFWDVAFEEELVLLLNPPKPSTNDTDIKTERLSIVGNISNYIQKKRGKDNASFIIVFLT